MKSMYRPHKVVEKFDATGRSLIYKVSNSGPSEKPWGTPHTTDNSFEFESPSLVYWNRLFKYVENKKNTSN